MARWFADHESALDYVFDELDENDRAALFIELGDTYSRERNMLWHASPAEDIVKKANELGWVDVEVDDE